MGRMVVVQVGDSIIINGKKGYIVRIKKRSYRSGPLTEYIVAARLNESQEIQFFKLQSETVNNFTPLSYEDVEWDMRIMDDCKQVTIEIESR